MSTLTARSPHIERASVALPTVTCSSCADPIPLSSLGEHICRPASKSSGLRSGSKPSQITIPPSTISSSAGSWRSPSSLDRAPPRPAFAGPSSARSSPGSNSLNIPDISSGLSSPIDRLSPHSSSSALIGGLSPSPRTPSPTNPFFPSLSTADRKPSIEYGLGLTVPHRAEGPFPTDAPLPAGVSDLSGLTNGEAGMAGVGRRAFQAAAWGVTAGISLAAGAHNRQAKSPTPQPNHPGTSNTASPHPPPRSVGPNSGSLPPWQQNAPTPRQPVIPPSAPLSGRSRSNTDARSPIPSTPVAPPVPTMPPRSASAMGRATEPVPAPARSASALAKSPPSASSAHRTRPSIASSTSSRSSNDANGGDSIAQMLKARAMERQGSNDKAGFFERYKQIQRSASQNSHGKSRLLPAATAGSEPDENRKEIMESPQQVALDLDDEVSALPWATPSLSTSPDLEQTRSRISKHQRKDTAESRSSSGSSGRYGASATTTEEIVTPSQSIEGVNLSSKKEMRSYGPSSLKQIHETEEDENERVVFGHALVNESSKVPRSGSNSTVTARDNHPYAQGRSRTAPVKRVKSCQKCGNQVGGEKKFVERDGVVLCEADWKKMYLPSCRRCKKLIETRMVSADDGQLKGKWHASCFTCTKCDQPFEDKDFYVHAGKPWCQYHYAEETGTLCASSTCRKPIEGACVLTQGSNPQRYHPGHLRCDQSGCQSSMDEYYDVAGQRFCERHVRAATHGKMDQAGRDLRAEKRKTRMIDLPKGGLC